MGRGGSKEERLRCARQTLAHSAALARRERPPKEPTSRRGAPTPAARARLHSNGSTRKRTNGRPTSVGLLRHGRATPRRRAAGTRSCGDCHRRRDRRGVFAADPITWPWSLRLRRVCRPGLYGEPRGLTPGTLQVPGRNRRRVSANATAPCRQPASHLEAAPTRVLTMHPPAQQHNRLPPHSLAAVPGRDALIAMRLALAYSACFELSV